MSGDNPMGALENDKLSSALNEIFSNPQMLSAISSMAESLKNGKAAQVSQEQDVKEPRSDETRASSAERLPELLSMLSSGSGIKQNRRSELLCALKPYLSQGRSEAIDKIIRFSELSSVLKNLS